MFEKLVLLILHDFLVKWNAVFEPQVLDLQKVAEII